MSFSVGAALKKVAVSLLTDKKVLKWAGGIVLGALIIIIIPFAVIISLGSGQIKIDTEGLKTAVQAQMNELKLSQSTVRRALRDLRKAKLIETEQRYRKNDAKSSLLYKLKR